MKRKGGLSLTRRENGVTDQLEAFQNGKIEASLYGRGNSGGRMDKAD